MWWVSPVRGLQYSALKVLNEDYEAQNITSPQFNKHCIILRKPSESLPLLFTLKTNKEARNLGRKRPQKCFSCTSSGCLWSRAALAWEWTYLYYLWCTLHQVITWRRVSGMLLLVSLTLIMFHCQNLIQLQPTPISSSDTVQPACFGRGLRGRLDLQDCNQPNQLRTDHSLLGENKI